MDTSSEKFQKAMNRNWLTPDLLDKSLTELRSYEWQWLDPNEPLPSRVIIGRFLDRITFGAYSRSQLKKASVPGLSENTWHSFAWECATIALNSTFAEAYARRALDGNLIFCTQGTMERLQGWDIHGNNLLYDTDCAVVDTAIALQLLPDWDGSLSAQGMLLWTKARPKRSMKPDLVWVNLAKTKLEKCLRLSRNSEVIQNCKEWLAEIHEATK